MLKISLNNLIFGATIMDLLITLEFFFFLIYYVFLISYQEEFQPGKYEAVKLKLKYEALKLIKFQFLGHSG